MKALIDGDMLLYRACLEAEYEMAWPDNPDLHYLMSDYQTAKQKYDDRLVGILQDARCEEYHVYFSLDGNWRKDLCPDYKGNRTGRKPLCLSRLKAEMLEGPHHSALDGFEADDLIGIAAQEPGTLILSHDKDFYSVPGRFRRWSNKDGLGPTTQTDVNQARFHHMVQTISGDRVDNYPGVPGYGKVKAERFLNTRLALYQEADEIPENLTGKIWDEVVDLFGDEDEAILNARLAYICHQEGDLIDPLWQPPY